MGLWIRIINVIKCWCMCASTNLRIPSSYQREWVVYWYSFSNPLPLPSPYLLPFDAMSLVFITRLAMLT